MSSLTVQLHDAPNTPLNLRFGVIYAPRVEAPPFVGFSVTEVQPHQYEIQAYDRAGHVQTVFAGALAETYTRLALHLRMDVAP